MTLLRCLLLIFAHFSIRELLEKDVGQVAGGLVQHCIHCAVHVSEYLTPHTTLEEVKVVVQVILKMLLKVMNTVAKTGKGICHGLSASFGKPSTDNFHVHKICLNTTHYKFSIDTVSDLDIY